MPTQPKPPSVMAAHCQRLRNRGLRRIEVQVSGEDAPLVRAVAAALTDPDQASAARAILERRIAPTPTRGLKDLLAAAPLDDTDLTRSRETGRSIDR